MESPTAVWNDYMKQREQGQQLMPDLIAIKNALTAETYKDGALSGKVKHLMALAVGLRAGCEICIVGHTMLALEAGASKEEVLETIGVGLTMGGTPGLAEAYKVIRLLEEQGKL